MDEYSGPVYGTVAHTCKRFGIGPSRLYEILGDGLISAKKFGKRILVDQRSAQQYFDALPAAEIKPSPRVHRRAKTARLQAELAAAATRGQAQDILASNRDLIDTLSRRDRERFLETAQDAINEKSE